MKKYIQTIKIASILLLLFPFLGLPQSLEHIYVIALGFVSGAAALLMQHKAGLFNSEEDETSLQEYVHDLKKKFKDQEEKIKKETDNRISDINIADYE